MTIEEVTKECHNRGWYGVIPIEFNGKFELNYIDGFTPAGRKLKVSTLGRGTTWEEALRKADKKAAKLFPDLGQEKP
jgi:hypothetical protein